MIKECDLQLYEGVAFLTNNGEPRLQATPPFNDGAALDPFDPGVFLNFTFASSFNKDENGNKTEVI